MQPNSKNDHDATRKPGMHNPKELTDRRVYNTPIGPVCMSRTEHEAYANEKELRAAMPDPR